MIQPESIDPVDRWQVFEEDGGFWRTGIYLPEFSSPEEIDRLERHSCPELFICQEDEMGLLVDEGSGEEEIILQPGEYLTVTGWHNGFRASEEGFFLVVERSNFETEYRDR